MNSKRAFNQHLTEFRLEGKTTPHSPEVAAVHRPEQIVVEVEGDGRRCVLQALVLKLRDQVVLEVKGGEETERGVAEGVYVHQAVTGKKITHNVY